MNQIIRMSFIALSFIFFFQVYPAFGQERNIKNDWTGKLKDGTVITEKDLIKILNEHWKLYEIDNNTSIPMDKVINDISEHIRNVSEFAYHSAACQNSVRSCQKES